MGIKLNITPEEMEELTQEIILEIEERNKKLVKFIKEKGQLTMESVVNNLKTHYQITNTSLEYEPKKYKKLTEDDFYMLFEALISFANVPEEIEGDFHYDFHSIYECENELIEVLYMSGQGGKYILRKPESNLFIRKVPKEYIMKFEELLEFYRNI